MVTMLGGETYHAMHVTPVALHVRETHPGVRLDRRGQYLVFVLEPVGLTVMVCSTFPSPSAKRKAQAEMVSYVAYWPEARLARSVAAHD